MDKELKIIPPEGYEVDKEHSTFECIKFKPIEPQLPTTWEEFCKTHPIKPGECYISPGTYSNITLYNYKCQRHTSVSTSVLPSLEYAKAMLALCQLIQLRDCYNDGWKPDWVHSNPMKYCIWTSQNRVITESLCVERRILAFRSKELRDKFLENFEDLIEIAKPLL